MQVRLIGKTQGAVGTEYEGKSICEIVVGIARLSSSRELNELFEEPDKLLRHCIINGHWSVFTESNLIIEITTSRAIGREFLRHWGMKPQELSQRYVPISEFEPIELRKQSKNNRQSSSEIIENPFLENIIEEHNDRTKEVYDALLVHGVSRETARFILPETAQTKIIFNAGIREWITTLNQRLHKTAQKEAREIAQKIRDILIKECPIISKALYNFEDAEEIHILDRLILEKFGCYNLVKDNNFKKLK